MNISAKTKLNAVIGYPLEHTLSPALHTYIYQELNLDTVLLAFANPNIEQLVGAIRALPIHLTAVTIPHKPSIIPLLDVVDPVAQDIGAVNTVLNKEGKLYGFNTDIVGVARAFDGVEIKNKKVLILGAGGAARALAYHLAREGGQIFCCDRTLEKAQEMLKKFNGQALEMGAVKGIDFDIIVNTTPLGMYPKVETSPLEGYAFNASQTVFDAIYNPRATKLLRQAREAGAKTISGMEMFIGQALEQVRLWSGKEFPVDKARKFLGNFLPLG